LTADAAPPQDAPASEGEEGEEESEDYEIYEEEMALMFALICDDQMHHDTTRNTSPWWRDHHTLTPSPTPIIALV